MPVLFSFVNVDNNAPTVSLFFKGGFTTILICFSQGIRGIFQVIGFTSWLIYGIVFFSLVVLKVKKYRHDDETVFRVPLLLPVVMTVVSLYLTIVPVASNPSSTYLYSILYSLCAVVVYFLFTKVKTRFRWYEKLTFYVQVILRVSPPKHFTN
jgi:amino acid transporter